MFLEQKSRNQSDMHSEDHLFFKDYYFLKSHLHNGQLQVLNKFKVDKMAKQVGQPCYKVRYIYKNLTEYQEFFFAYWWYIVC